MAGAGTYKNKVNGNQNKLLEHVGFFVYYNLTAASAPTMSSFSAISYLS